MTSLGRKQTEDDRWRDNPTIPAPIWERTDVRWHERGTLPDGTPVGKLGALWYVLDDQGAAISKGYHHIWPENGRLIGKLGATTEPVEYPAMERR